MTFASSAGGLVLADEDTVPAEPVAAAILLHLVAVADHVDYDAIRPTHAHLSKMHALQPVRELMQQVDGWPVERLLDVDPTDPNEHVIDEIHAGGRDELREPRDPRTALTPSFMNCILCSRVQSVRLLHLDLDSLPWFFYVNCRRSCHPWPPKSDGVIN
jgi:hypothetical protein